MGVTRTHFWVRGETRNGERRVAVTPDGVAALLSAGHAVTVEDDPNRAIPVVEYRAAGAMIAPMGGWRYAPGDAVILGLKELPDDAAPLRHRHIMFGHAYKGQADGPALLARFRAGGGRLQDIEYLAQSDGRRLAAFGYWAGYAGAAVGLLALAAQADGGQLGPVAPFSDRDALVAHLRGLRLGSPSVIVIGALGRVGTGACDLAGALGLPVTRWDMAETARGSPFPEILGHKVFVNAIYAREGTPVFVDRSALRADRALRVVADVSCDPTSPFNPVPIYDHATSFDAPVLRVANDPLLDVMAIDNLPSLLPREASEDFAAQLLPALLRYPDGPEWARADALFAEHAARGVG